MPTPASWCLIAQAIAASGFDSLSDRVCALTMEIPDVA